MLKTVSSFILDDHILARAREIEKARQHGTSIVLLPVKYKIFMGRTPFDLNSADEVEGIREEN